MPGTEAAGVVVALRVRPVKKTVRRWNSTAALEGVGGGWWEEWSVGVDV
jgi:hypothetical protein